MSKYVIEIRTTQEHGKVGCQISNQQGEILHTVAANYIHENDAIYTALHELAMQNNFTGCLKDAECWISVKDALPPLYERVEVKLDNQVVKSYLHLAHELESGELSLWWWGIGAGSQDLVQFWRKPKVVV